MMRIRGEPVETPADIERVCREGWTEGQQLEFKREDADGGRTVAAEVVALANHLGGHVIIGIDESDDKPSRAGAVTPIAECRKAAASLGRQLRDQIDPPLRGVSCVPIETDASGAGVIIVEVPQSLFGPHRSKFDMQVYQKNGEEKRRLNMTEIHRLVLAFEKREDRVEQRFEAMRRPHNQPFIAKHGLLHMRVAGCPLGDVHLDLQKFPSPWFIPTKLRSTKGAADTSEPPIHKIEERPLLRGRFREHRSDQSNHRAYWHENGSIQMIRYLRPASQGFPSATDLVGHLFSLLTVIDQIALHADYTGSEYGIEVEAGSATVCQLESFGFPEAGDELGRRHDLYAHALSNQGFMLPRYLYSSGGDKVALINTIWTDFWHELGAEPPDTLASIEIA